MSLLFALASGAAEKMPSQDQAISATINSEMGAGIGLIVVAVIIHGMGLFTLRRLIFSDQRGPPVRNWKALSLKGASFTVLTVLALVVLHMIEVFLYAVFYDYVDALPNFDDALYFSTISYATIGYNDEAIMREWRMVAALEGMLGVILLGWSTAFLMRVVGRLTSDEEGGD